MERVLWSLLTADQPGSAAFERAKARAHLWRWLRALVLAQFGADAASAAK